MCFLATLTAMGKVALNFENLGRPNRLLNNLSITLKYGFVVVDSPLCFKFYIHSLLDVCTNGCHCRDDDTPPFKYINAQRATRANFVC